LLVLLDSAELRFWFCCATNAIVFLLSFFCGKLESL
jgi:hypothetical protein